MDGRAALATTKFCHGERKNLFNANEKIPSLRAKKFRHCERSAAVHRVVRELAWKRGKDSAEPVLG
jgi:hypothetical protein